jgi:hypothetical protein
VGPLGVSGEGEGALGLVGGVAGSLVEVRRQVGGEEAVPGGPAGRLLQPRRAHLGP